MSNVDAASAAAAAGVDNENERAIAQSSFIQVIGYLFCCSIGINNVPVTRSSAPLLPPRRLPNRLIACERCDALGIECECEEKFLLRLVASASTFDSSAPAVQPEDIESIVTFMRKTTASIPVSAATRSIWRAHLPRSSNPMQSSPSLESLSVECLATIISFLDTHTLIFEISRLPLFMRNAALSHPLSWAGRQLHAHRLAGNQANQSRLLLRDAYFTARAASWRALTALSLSNCRSLTDEAVQAVANSCPLLQSICLDRCSRLTDASLYSLGSNCHNLIVVDLTLVYQISDRGLLHLMTSCNRIEVLSLAYCVHLTQDSVGKLARHCPRLRSLWVCYCVHLTDAVIKQLVSGCLQLRMDESHARGCESISAAALLFTRSAHTIPHVVRPTGATKSQPRVDVDAHFTPIAVSVSPASQSTQQVEDDAASSYEPESDVFVARSPQAASTLMSVSPPATPAHSNVHALVGDVLVELAERAATASK